jgi:hypothetical protein
MAKISARGATKVAEFRSADTAYVVCSDGRILSRYLDTGSAFTIWARIDVRKVPTMVRHLEDMSTLTRTV